jgi:hypothetical protein
VPGRRRVPGCRQRTWVATLEFYERFGPDDMTSMLEDRRAGRPTEQEAITSAFNTFLGVERAVQQVRGRGATNRLVDHDQGAILQVGINTGIHGF